MALFRAITGQEEAARAIFHALQRQQYPDSRRLNWHDHTQKAAVVPFMVAMERLLKDIGGTGVRVVLGEYQGERALQVEYTIVQPNGQPLTFTCDPPLDVQLSIDGRPYSLEREIASVASDANYKNMEQFVREIADERNYLLYASDQGIPTQAGQPIRERVAERRHNVFSMLTLYLLIDPHWQQQPFVSQALQNFPRMVNKLPLRDTAG
jgi:hypothetical protein